jgi:hypothetical protein
LVDFLLGSHAAARYLVEKFVFMIVPMMCIDGVVEGFYRCSLLGDDLNRVWHAPDANRHPEVYHAKELLQQIGQHQPIEVYIDFHGHSCQHGTFAFGCPNDAHQTLAHTEKLFPRIISALTDAFTWQKCLFSTPDERKTAGRIVVRQEFGVVQAFTIETSFGGVAGLLYDERSWREIGAKIAEALYHLLTQTTSSLRAVAQADIAREVERQREGVAYSQNTKNQGVIRKQPVVRKQPAVRKAVVPHVKKCNGRT